MKSEPTHPRRPRTELGKAAARALTRSAASARVTAARFNTKIHVIEEGRIVSLEPTAKPPSTRQNGKP